ncbi:zinc transporter [Clostridia bacterium]|nr:zinc transporter [Clostridia bacterium]
MQVLYAAAAGGLTWFATAAGAAIVFAEGRKHIKLPSQALLGFSAGIMIAASVMSLLIPAFEMCGGRHTPALIGFAVGCAIFLGVERLEFPDAGIMRLRSFPMVAAVMFHNIPEGLAIGVAFGSAGLGSGSGGVTGAEFAAAISLTVGIAIQNPPEGAAVSLPLHADGVSRCRSFFFGAMSAVTEPIFAIVGAYFAARGTAAQSFGGFGGFTGFAMLSGFAAGAMITVAVNELIPRSRENLQNTKSVPSGVIGTLLGFILMMWLE